MSNPIKEGQSFPNSFSENIVEVNRNCTRMNDIYKQAISQLAIYANTIKIQNEIIKKYKDKYGELEKEEPKKE